MKKLIITLSISAVSLVHGATIEQSGNWSDPLTWGLTDSETVPTTQDTVSFRSSGLSLTADVDATISTFNLDKATIKEYSFSVKNGKTLKISKFPNSAVETNTTLNIGSTTDSSVAGRIEMNTHGNGIRNTILNLNSGTLYLTTNTHAGTATNGGGHYNTTFNIAAGTTLELDTRMNGSGTKMYIYGDVKVLPAATFTTCGGGSNFFLYEGGSITANNIRCTAGASIASNGSYTQRVFVDGTVNVSGGEISYKSRYYALRFGDANNNTSVSVSSLTTQSKLVYDIGSHAVINQTSSNSKYLVETLGILNVADGAKLNLQNGFGLIGMSTLNINAKNAFATNVAGSTQQDAKFVVTDKSGTMAVTAPTMNINASNDFGNVEFDLAEAHQYGGATLTINVAEGVNVSFKSLFSNYKDYDDGYGNNNAFIEFIINGLSDKMNFKLTDMDDILKDYSSELYFVHFKDGNGNALLVTEVNGDYYVSASALVPEPAEWAMIFGAFALGLVWYRKRL